MQFVLRVLGAHISKINSSHLITIEHNLVLFIASKLNTIQLITSKNNSIHLFTSFEHNAEMFMSITK